MNTPKQLIKRTAKRKKMTMEEKLEQFRKEIEMKRKFLKGRSAA